MFLWGVIIRIAPFLVDIMEDKKELLGNEELTPDVKRDKFKARLKSNTLMQIQRLMKYHGVSVEDLMKYLESEYAVEMSAYIQQQRNAREREKRRLEGIAKSRAAKKLQKEQEKEVI